MIVLGFIGLALWTLGTLVESESLDGLEAAYARLRHAIDRERAVAA